MSESEPNLDVIEERAGKAADWSLADPFGTGEVRPAYVRRHFEEDMPALLTELRTLRIIVSKLKVS